MPACDAVMVHVPVASSAMVVQTVGELDVKLTGKPDVAIAERAGVLERGTEPGLLNAMVWPAATMENDCVTGVAAA